MQQTETAIFAGGCFWCTEAVFASLRGVLSVKSGYSGGLAVTANYEKVSMGTTNHAQAIEVKFDTEEISYRDLLEVFFATHDPTTLNRQGADVGTQYRSAIFYTTESQKKIAEDIFKELEDDKTFQDPIVTELVQLESFYPAEDYHDNYYARNNDQPYCQVVINPKLIKFKQKFASLLKH